MDRVVYIIHPSAIVHSGLSDILRQNYKCVIKTFYSFIEFQESVKTLAEKSIFLTEDAIADTEAYTQFMNGLHQVYSYTIIDGASVSQKHKAVISLRSKPDAICQQLSEAFKVPDVSEDENDELSNREIEVLKLVALGFANKEIAEKLFISTHTVMSHRKNMTEKLGIKSISGLTVYAIINNYIDTTNLDIKDLI